MILVDSSVWIDHLRSGNPMLTDLLNAEAVLCHPFVIGELALGSLPDRHDFLALLRDLPRAMEASNDEVQLLIEAEYLFGRGIGYVDAHLLASARLTAGSRLWARDRRLHENAMRLGIAWQSDRPH